VRYALLSCLPADKLSILPATRKEACFERDIVRPQGVVVELCLTWQRFKRFRMALFFAFFVVQTYAVIENFFPFRLGRPLNAWVNNCLSEDRQRRHGAARFAELRRH
jgi:hypothetical protein